MTDYSQITLAEYLAMNHQDRKQAYNDGRLSAVLTGKDPATHPTLTPGQQVITRAEYDTLTRQEQHAAALGGIRIQDDYPPGSYGARRAQGDKLRAAYRNVPPEERAEWVKFWSAN